MTWITQPSDRALLIAETESAASGVSAAAMQAATAIQAAAAAIETTASVEAAAEESGFVVALVMAWSPVRRANAG